MMSDPEKAHFTCIGCGASVPVGSDLCPGCRHRFAGPDVGPSPDRSLTAPSYRPPPSPSGPGLLDGIARMTVFFATGILTMFAALVAFVVTCAVTVNSLGAHDFDIFAGPEPQGYRAGLILGLIAALTVVAGSIYLGIRASAPEAPRRKVDR